MSSKQKPKIGDICEIKTPAGLGYVQYTHDGKGSGELVRVLPGLFSTRPTDFSELARQKELYFVFYALEYALRGHRTEIVSNQPVPDEWLRAYPLMRWGVPDRTGKWLWKIFSASAQLTLEEHVRTPVVRELTPEQKKLSILVLRPHSAMVKELARGWMPERDEELLQQDIATAKQARDAQGLKRGTAGPMKHYIYFPKKPKAEKASERLKDQGFLVEVRKGADGENWLVLATKSPPKTGEQMDELRDQMEGLAAELGGEYDGWEAAIDALGPGSDTNIN